MKILYPTPKQIDVLLRWANDGSSVLADPEAPRSINGQDRTRTDSLNKIRSLIERFGLSEHYRELLVDVHKRPIEELNRDLLDELIRVARFYGYVYPRPDPQGWGPVWHRTPLTGRMLHVIREISSGDSSEQTGRRLGCDASSVRRTLGQARHAAGCRTTPQLISLVYRSGWMPLISEMRDLTGERPVGPGHLIISTKGDLS